MRFKEIIFILFRYFIIIIVGVLNIILAEKNIFYLIFTPITIYPVYFIFDYLYNAVLLPNNIIFFGGHYIQIVSACIAGSAYYLLLILNLSTPMSLKKRFYNLIFIFVTFLIANIIRIIIFGLLFFKGYRYFDITHLATWYIGSTLLVILIWFSGAIIFKIQNIPVYNDLKSIFNYIRKIR